MSFPSPFLHFSIFCSALLSVCDFPSMRFHLFSVFSFSYEAIQSHQHSLTHIRFPSLTFSLSLSHSHSHSRSHTITFSTQSMRARSRRLWTPRLAHMLLFRVVLKVTKTVVLLQVEYFFSISCYTMFLTCNKMAMFNKDVARWQCYKLWSAYRRSMSQKGLYF